MTQIVDFPEVESGKAARFGASRMSTKELSERKAAKAALRKTQTVILRDGVKVYPDNHPGVGWVLEWRGYADRYLATKELAIEHFKLLSKTR
jgi:hypothetical protein